MSTEIELERTMILHVDVNRVHLRGTGIYVRAKHENGHFGSFDIAELTRESLLVWLRSRGGYNPWAEDVVGVLLGHGCLNEPKG